jgi:hypothetical protein
MWGTRILANSATLLVEERKLKNPNSGEFGYDNLEARMRRSIALLGWLALTAPALGADPNGVQMPPTRVMADGKPVDTERSAHAAPYFADFYGNGLPDLIVGEFYGGRMWVYKNIGKPGQPKFDKRQPIIASGEQACIEAG